MENYALAKFLLHLPDKVEARKIKEVLEMLVVSQQQIIESKMNSTD